MIYNGAAVEKAIVAHNRKEALIPGLRTLLQSKWFAEQWFGEPVTGVFCEHNSVRYYPQSWYYSNADAQELKLQTPFMAITGSAQ